MAHKCDKSKEDWVEQVKEDRNIYCESKLYNNKLRKKICEKEKKMLLKLKKKKKERKNFKISHICCKDIEMGEAKWASSDM